MFFEHELGHEMLQGNALAEGMPIIPVITESLHTQIPTDTNPAPENEIPLDPLPAQQHIEKLPDERHGERQFIQWDPSEIRGNTTSQRKVYHALQAYAELKAVALEEMVEEKEEEWQVDVEDTRLLIPETEKLIPKGYKVALRTPGWKRAM